MAMFTALFHLPDVIHNATELLPLSANKSNKTDANCNTNPNRHSNPNIYMHTLFSPICTSRSCVDDYVAADGGRRQPRWRVNYNLLILSLNHSSVKLHLIL